MNKRNREEFDLFIRNRDTFSDNNLDDDIVTNFGPPPYEFLQEGDSIQLKSTKRKKSNIQSPRMHLKYPNPNYTTFGRPEYLDSMGREYSLTKGDLRKKYIDDRIITDETYEKPSQFIDEEIGSLVLNIRIPIRTRNTVQNPSAFLGGDSIDLIHIETQIICTCSVDSIFMSGRRKTGYLIVKNFRTFGKTPMPHLYKDYLSVTNSASKSYI